MTASCLGPPFLGLAEAIECVVGAVRLATRSFSVAGPE